ncbi:MAG: hypothetical protein ACOCXT_02620 [Candidatus Dojkabacteria bacterium]
MENGKNTKKILLIVAGIIVAFLAGIGIGFAVWEATHDDTQDEEQQENSNGNGDQTTPTPTPTPMETPTPTPTPTGEEIELQVFFSRRPESNNDFDFTSGRERNTTRKDVGTFAIQELIEGPSEDAQDQGLYSPIELQGESNCDGQDFTLFVEQNGEAVLQFCKDLQIAGVGDAARIESTVTDTLEQFSTVETITILTKDGGELGDLSDS